MGRRPTNPLRLACVAILLAVATHLRAADPGATAGPYVSSLGAAFDPHMNELWRIFGLGGRNPASGQPMLGGRKWWGTPVSASDGDFIELKLAWYDDPATLTTLRQDLLRIPIDPDGYVWAAADGRRHLNQHTLWHTNADFINALWEFWRWNGDVAWLTHATPAYSVAVAGDDAAIDRRIDASDFVHFIHGDGMSLAQDFRTARPFRRVLLKLAVTDKSKYEIRLFGASAAEPTASGRFDGRTGHTNGWASLALDREAPAGAYRVELRNLGRYHHERLAWYGSERGVGTNGTGAMNGLAGLAPLDRARLAMKYQLDDTGMRGAREGIVVIPSPDHSGTPQPVGLRTGRAMPSTYYDLVRSGPREAFVNARYVKSLASLAALEDAAGFPDKAAALRVQRDRARAAFHRTFWNPRTGRYAGWVDATGRMWDYGEVEYNLEALLWTDPPPEAARSIVDWISGRRIVAGDTSTGADLYAWGFAPRKNTLAYESLGAETNHWWGGWFWDFRPDGTGRADFGHQEENGGTNPFIGYYDVLARLKINGPDDAWRRFFAADNSVIREFATDQWNRPAPGDPNHPGGRYKAYVLDLPEAGLPAVAVLHGFMGVDPDGRELRVRPRLPQGVAALGIRNVHFRGRRWTIEARADGTCDVRPDPPDGSPKGASP